MGDKQLREDLERLRAEISALDSDEQGKENLTKLVVDIEEQLQQAKLHETAKSFGDQLEAAISKFETTHPTLTGILNNVLVALSGMGV